MTTAKYLHALDTLYKNQEIELKIKNTKLKEAEAEVQALRKELLMLNSQLSTMREEGTMQARTTEIPRAFEDKEKKKENLLREQLSQQQKDH